MSTAIRTRLAIVALIAVCGVALATFEPVPKSPPAFEPAPIPLPVAPPPTPGVPHSLDVIVGGGATSFPTEEELPQVTPTSWCALPRPEEPLLKDAIEMAQGFGPNSIAFSLGFLAGNSTVVVIFEELTCRRLSQLVTGLVEPVLVVRVGALYLVDTQLPRNGDYWQVDAFNLQFELVGSGYGVGA